MKLKSFLTAKKTMTRVKRKPREWDKTYDRGIIPTMCKSYTRL